MSAAEGNARIRVRKTRPFGTFQDARCIFHMTACLFCIRVWCWHCSERAKVLTGFSEFGWFFRYLTFWSFTAQCFQLVLATLADLTPKGKNIRLKRDAEDLSCMIFGTSTTVTLMYYSLQLITQGGLDEGDPKDRVWWINFTVHVVNSLIAWIDVFISTPRKFSARSKKLTVLFAVLYCGWINFIKFQSGIFPYPFLDKMPQPYGIIGVIIVGNALMLCILLIGRLLSDFGESVFGKEDDVMWEISDAAKTKAKERREMQKGLYEELKVE